MQTRDQKRAAMVFARIQPLATEGKLGKKYGALALNAPTLIRTAGLAQAVAFYEAKNEPHHKRFLQHLEDELREIQVLPNGDGLRHHAVNCDLTTYMRLTRETLALCQWHKRFSQSVLKVEPGGDDE